MDFVAPNQKLNLKCSQGRVCLTVRIMYRKKVLRIDLWDYQIRVHAQEAWWSVSGCVLIHLCTTWMSGVTVLFFYWQQQCEVGYKWDSRVEKAYLVSASHGFNERSETICKSASWEEQDRIDLVFDIRIQKHIFQKFGITRWGLSGISSRYRW